VIPALSLAGVPPLSGFWAKLLLAKATLDDGRYGLTFAVLAVGLLTLFAMARVWSEVFWDAHPDGDHAITARVPLAMLAPLLVLTALVIWVGVNAGPFVDAAMALGAEIVDPAAYIAAVLRPRP
jgi:multicomponent Na+:H+ antiporter subunit D